MHFGIMEMQIEYLVPPASPGQPPEQVLASLVNFDHPALVRNLAGHGFKLIELGGDLGMLFPHSFSPAAVEGLAQVKSELGLRYTLHLPLWSVEPSTLQQPVRQGSVQALIQNIQDTLSLHPEIYVLHATGALAAEFYRMRIPEMARALMMRQFQANARQSIQKILRETDISPRQLAIETVEFPFDLTLELAEEFDASICLDTGHVLVGFSGPIDLFEALERSLPRLGEVHLHDGPWQGPQMNIGYGKDHQALGKGDLEVGRLLDRLQAAAYRGPIIFELTVKEALASLEVVRSLRPALLA